MRLSLSTASSLNSSVQQPAYDRSKMANGIVHFGLGAFTRAHQIAYTDMTMNAGDRDWMTTGISLRSGSAREKLAPQDGMYLLAQQSASGTDYRLIGALRDVLVAPEQPNEVIARLADPATCIVTLTITEKGYLRGAAGGVDLSHRDIVHDLEGAGVPRTIYGFLHSAITRRMKNAGAGFTLVCCDNLPANGRLLELLITEYLAAVDPHAADWFRDHCACPSTMVDRIVPATTDADIDAAEAACGLRDEGLVVTEVFRQWVIEDRFAGPRPGWEGGGAQFVTDVAPYETAKLRMLNGAHSALAYIGLNRGHEYVHEAVRDPYMRELVERLMKEEAAPSIDAAHGQDLNAYADALIARFENPALLHRLSQIAMDGSQKIPQRWLETLAANREAPQRCTAILTALAHWSGHVRPGVGKISDPMRLSLERAWKCGCIESFITACLTEGILQTEWRPSAWELDFLQDVVVP